MLAHCLRVSYPFIYVGDVIILFGFSTRLRIYLEPESAYIHCVVFGPNVF
jgi:hypothetical protein